MVIVCVFNIPFDAKLLGKPLKLFSDHMTDPKVVPSELGEFDVPI